MDDANENEDESSPVRVQSRADRFLPSRDGGALSAVYSVTDDIRSQSNHSPEPNKGTYHYDFPSCNT